MQPRTILTAMLLAVASIAVAQIEQYSQEPQRKVYDIVEQMPEFPGGTQALFEYLDENREYPIVAQENGVQGRVVVSFVVEADGSIDGVRVTRSVDPSLDREAARVISEMPKWIPGKRNGKAVAVKYNIPVTFRLGEYTKSTPNITDKKKNKSSKTGFYIVGLTKPGPNPIIIVDGKTVDPDDFTQLSIKSINTFEVLKNPQEIAKYGKAGRHGVILITTK